MELRQGTSQEAGVSRSGVKKILERAAGWVDDGIHPSLVILAARRGVIFLHEALGSLGTEDPSSLVKLNTIFPLASISKPITATAAMILVEDGLLGINRRVQEYIPEWEGEAKDQVIVQHLLTHTSGIDDESTWEVREKKVSVNADTPPCEETQHPIIHRWFNYGLDVPLANKPGIEMSYSNYGYQILGEIIRRVCGQPLQDFAAARIFEPLGMKDTWYSVPSSESHRVVKQSSEGPFANEDMDELQEAPSPSGGVFSTAFDIARFCQMFINQGNYGNERILSPVTVKSMTRNQIPGIPARYQDETFPEGAWGLGWSINAPYKGEIFGEPLLSRASYSHTGATGALIWVDPSLEVVGVYLSVLLERWDAVSHSTGVRKHWFADRFMNMTSAACE
jgi:CubicO group peptidase (beta-lactamase class C family)